MNRTGGGNLTPEAAEQNLQSHLDLLIESSPDGKQRTEFARDMNGFKHLFSSFVRPETRKIDWAQIAAPDDVITPLASIDECPSELLNELLDKLVVIKLNGGLGTTMGCTGPKSLIEVHSGYSFLDLTVRQVEYLNNTYHCDVPLVLMNSFNTDQETDEVLSKYQNSNVSVHCFTQHRYPRFYKDSSAPVPLNYEDAKEAWYPPGHGDIFSAFHQSDLFQHFLNKGKEYVFISNIDNLGATVEANILYHMHTSGSEFFMEVTDKTRADVKGGTLIKYGERVKLLEIAQVPSEYVEEFKSVKKFKIFNTNNLWVNLKAIDRLERENAMRSMDVIVNYKSLRGKPIVQLERAAGAAIEFFSNARGINVPRSRFLPVKGASDLLLVQSNLYTLSHGTLVLNSRRQFAGVPLVKLGPEFAKVDDYMERLAGIPDLLELDHLTVSGDVTFGKHVSLKGTVIIVANHGSRIDIPPGSVLENKVVSGNLRILDH